MTTGRSGDPIAATSFDVDRPDLGERAARFFDRLLELTFYWRYKDHEGFTTFKRIGQLMRERRFSRAVALCRYLRAQPWTAPPFVAAALVTEAQLSLQLGHVEKARALLLRVDLTTVAKGGRAQHALVGALVARDQHDFVQMLHHADAAVALDATKAALSMRAIALKNLDRIVEAIDDIKRALELAPLDGALLLTLAGYRFLVDQDDAARLEVRRVWESTEVDRGDELTWLLNVAWSAALIGDDDRVFASLSERAKLSDNAGARYMLRFLDVERDMHRLRADPRMAQLKARLAVIN